jgi:hypothetical protein
VPVLIDGLLLWQISVVTDFLPSGRVLVHYAQHLIKTQEWFSFSSSSFLAEIGTFCDDLYDSFFKPIDFEAFEIQACF